MKKCHVRQKSKIFIKLLQAVLPALVVLSSCAIRNRGSYVVRSAKSSALSKDSRIGVYVQPGFSSGWLGGYMTSSLMTAGYSVKEIQPKKILPSTIQDLVIGGNEDTLYTSVVEQIAQGGKMSMNEGVFAKVYADNSIKQGQEIMADWVKLIAQFARDFQITHILYMYPSFNPYSYYVELIDVASRQVVFNYYINANAVGFYQKISRPETHEGLTISRPDRRDRSPDEIVFCEHIAKLIQE